MGGLVSDDRPGSREADQAGSVTRQARPVTFREVFADREYRALYLALLASWLGDYLARAAVAVLVYQESESVLLSAAAFAVSYLPWLVGGPPLTALAERYPYRGVMVVCDLLRMALIFILIVPGMPVAAMAANATTMQAAQVVGYLCGATLVAAVHPQLAIGINALAFGLSALLVRAG